jgi:peptidoglycan/xylan/chitin deacetylase (PgdA/CDA1 family)
MSGRDAKPTPTRLPILTFHAIDDLPSVTSFPPHLFRLWMARLHAGGYRTLDLAAAAACLRHGEPIEERSLVITFDDGYRTVYEEAFPVLKAYGMSATVFLTVGEDGARALSGRLPSYEGRTMLAWPEIREMQGQGFAFGAHTMTHPDLTRLSADRIEAEVRGAKTTIEEATGVPVTSFAYPFGCYDRCSRAIVQQYFACACSDELGFVAPGGDIYALKRVETFYLRHARLLGIMLSPLFPWYLGACSVPRRLRRATDRQEIG